MENVLKDCINEISFSACKARHVIGYIKKGRVFRLYWLSCTVTYLTCVISVVRWCCYGKMWSAVPRRLFLITSFGNAVKKKRAFCFVLWRNCQCTAPRQRIGQRCWRLCRQHRIFPRRFLARGELLNGPSVSGPSVALKSRANTRWLATKLHTYLHRSVRKARRLFKFKKY